MLLKHLGWNKEYEEKFNNFKDQGYSVGRIGLEFKGIYKVFSENGELLSEVSGKLRFNATTRDELPAVGDWVVISPRQEEKKATIHAILPRKSKFSRKVAGNLTEEQIVATNIDTAFIVVALNQDFNLRRIERYLVVAWESGADPVIILSKADLCTNIEERIKDVQDIAIGVPLIPISAMEGLGIEELEKYLEPGKTVALLGSSGVGKSTLLNTLIQRDIQAVQEVRSDDGKGKHTTTSRQMFLLPSGGILIDTPGMRELQLWESDTSNTTFQDIEELAQLCKFGNCKHLAEPGCSVREAIQNGDLDEKRYNNYVKLQKEQAYFEKKNMMKTKLNEKGKLKEKNSKVRVKHFSVDE